MQSFSRLKSLTHIIFIMALLSSMGGNWLMLQSIAWTNMLWSYTHTSSPASTVTVKNAVKMTFDGKHPCNICKKIVKAKTKEKPVPSLILAQVAYYPFPKLSGVLHLFPLPFQYEVIISGVGKLAQPLGPPLKPPRFV